MLTYEQCDLVEKFILDRLPPEPHESFRLEIPQSECVDTDLRAALDELGGDIWHYHPLDAFDICVWHRRSRGVYVIDIDYTREGYYIPVSRS